MLKVGVKKSLDCSRLLLMTRHHQDLEFLISHWGVERHTFVAALGEFWPMLEDVMNLTTLPPYGETNAIGHGIQKRGRR